MRFNRTLRTFTVLGSLVLAVIAGPSNAQVDEAMLSAAYIYNFTQFTTWPAGGLSDSKLVVCANGESALGIALANLNGKIVSGRAWTFGSLSHGDGPSGCNVVLVEEGKPLSKQTREVLNSDRPVLVITNSTLDTQDTVIRLVTDGNHLRFDINNREAARRHLSLSSKLLQLARTVL
ncbi:protein of unknown function [Burkholderia sp. WP9]|jgi:hypothetical protein|uniref:YfiR family protein n=1 Tax=Burkholderiaceae TaxID=119060 RepID=UPI0008980F73|nr:YfiR family protein [Burkholderia sp. WP9]SEE89958.1 protein of unknown function [Burkholderia sp. WP9]